MKVGEFHSMKRKILSMIVPVGVGCWCFYTYLIELIRVIGNGDYQHWNGMTLIYAMVGLIFFFLAFRIAKGLLVPNTKGMVCWGLSVILLASGSIKQLWFVDVMSYILLAVGTLLVVNADPNVLKDLDKKKE